MMMAGGGQALPEIGNISTEFTNLGSFSVGVMAGLTDGDLLLFTGVARTASSGVWAAPSGGGWTEDVDDIGRGGHHKTASGESDWTVTNPMGSGYELNCCFVDVKNAVFDVAGALGTSGISPEAPAITLAADDSILFAIFSHNTNNADITTPSGFTELYKMSQGNRPMVAVYYKTGVAAGNTGGVSTTSTSSLARGYLIGVGPV